MDTNTLTPDQRVERGAAWLDVRAPDWRDKLTDLDALDVTDGDNCVLQQVFGDWLTAAWELCSDEPEAGEHGTGIYGFNADNPADMRDIRQAWQVFMANSIVKDVAVAA